MTVKSKSLNELDCAIDYLRQHGAARDAVCGQWTLPDGVALGANPILAAKALRTALIRKTIDDTQRTGRGYFTR